MVCTFAHGQCRYLTVQLFIFEVYYESAVLVGEITTRSYCIAATQQAQQFCRTEHTPVHLKTAAVLRGDKKETYCINTRGTRWRRSSRHCGHRRVADSVPVGVTGIFHDNPSGCTMALGSIQSLTEMSTRNVYWAVKVAGELGWQTSHLHVSIVSKSGGFKLPEPSGPVIGLYRVCFTPYCINIQGLGLTRTASQLNRSTHFNKLHSVLASAGRLSAITISAISYLYTHLSPGGIVLKLCTMHCSSPTRTICPFHPLLILITQSMITLCRYLLFRDRWRTLVSVVMNLRVPWNAGNYLTSCKPVSFSRTLHHGVSKMPIIPNISHLPVTSPFLELDILHGTLLSNTFIFPHGDKPIFTPIQNSR